MQEVRTMRYLDDPFDMLANVRAQLYRLLDEFAAAVEPMWAGGWVPATDIRVGDGEVTLEAEVPGLAREDIEVTVAGQVVTIAGERKAERAEGEEFVRQERPTGRFERSFSLPWALEAEGVQAKLENGVLRVTVPRAKVTVVKVEAEEG